MKLNSYFQKKVKGKGFRPLLFDQKGIKMRNNILGVK